MQLALTLCLIWASHANAYANMDPTRPLTGGSQLVIGNKAITQLALESIITRGNSRIAIVNGKMLKLGDAIGAYQLNKITDNTVLLTSFEGELELKLFPAQVAKSK